MGDIGDVAVHHGGGGGKVVDTTDSVSLPGHNGKLSELRSKPGVASHGSDLPRIKEGDRWLKGTHGNAGKVPAQIAEKLSGRKFANFDAFRESFWMEVAADPVLSRQFSLGNQSLMKKGRSPVALPDEQVGRRIQYELDHNIEIQHGGGVYDMNNIVVRSPHNHIEKTK